MIVNDSHCCKWTFDIIGHHLTICRPIAASIQLGFVPKSGSNAGDQAAAWEESVGDAESPEPVRQQFQGPCGVDPNFLLWIEYLFGIVWEYGNVLFVKSNLPIMLHDSLIIVLEQLCFVFACLCACIWYTCPFEHSKWLAGIQVECFTYLSRYAPRMQGRCSGFCPHNFLVIFDIFAHTIPEGSFGRHIEMAFTEVLFLRWSKVAGTKQVPSC